MKGERDGGDKGWNRNEWKKKDRIRRKKLTMRLQEEMWREEKYEKEKTDLMRKQCIKERYLQLSVGILLFKSDPMPYIQLVGMAQDQT